MLVLVSRELFDAATDETIKQLNNLQQGNHSPADVVVYSQEIVDDATLIKNNLGFRFLGNPLQENLDKIIAGYSEKIIVIDKAKELPFRIKQISVEHYSQLGDFIESIEPPLPQLPPPPLTHEDTLETTATQSTQSKRVIDELYNEIRDQLTPERVTEEDLNAYFTHEKALMIINYKRELLDYEKGLNPLPNPSLLDGFYRHHQTCHTIWSLLGHWLMNISQQSFLGLDFCNYQTRDKLQDLNPEMLLQWRNLILYFCPEETTVSHSTKAHLLARMINNTALTVILKTEVASISWYIMDHILAEAATKSSPADSGTYLEEETKPTTAIRRVLQSNHLEYLRAKMEEYNQEINEVNQGYNSGIKTLMNYLKWNRRSVPQKPDSMIDFTHKAAPSQNKTLTMVGLLTDIKAEQLEEQCHQTQTYRALIGMSAINRKIMVDTIIKSVCLEATGQGTTDDDFELESPEYYQYQYSELSKSIRTVINDEHETIDTETAFARVIGDKISIIHAEIERLRRMEWIAIHRKGLNNTYEYATEDSNAYGAFIRAKVNELNLLIKQKLDWYVIGPWARKSDDDVKNEICGLESLRTALVNLNYMPSASSESEEVSTTTNPTFIDALTTAINQVRSLHQAGFSKHGNFAFFGSISPSKAEVFTQRILADAQTLRREYTDVNIMTTTDNLEPRI
jgi:hypothetical protein